MSETASNGVRRSPRIPGVAAKQVQAAQKRPAPKEVAKAAPKAKRTAVSSTNQSEEPLPGPSGEPPVLQQQVMEDIVTKLSELSRELKAVKDQVNQQNRVPECSVPDSDSSSTLDPYEKHFQGELNDPTLNVNSPSSPYVMNNSNNVLPGHDQRQMVDAGMPLGFAVPHKIKKELWEGNMIDLFCLLSSDPTSSDFTFKFDPSKESGFVVKQKSKTIYQIEVWVKAFTVFIAISAEHPATAHEVPGLMTYMSEIQSMAKDQYDFVSYDYHYRLERSYRSDKPSWATINQPLHNMILRKGKIFRGQNSNKDKKSGTGKVPKGSCFNFHAFNKPCLEKPCQFSHDCYRCGQGQHRASSCTYGRNASKSTGDKNIRKHNYSNKE